MSRNARSELNPPTRGGKRGLRPPGRAPISDPASLSDGRWMLDVGCWTLDVGCWTPDVGCSAAGSETGTPGESPRSHAEGFHRLHSGNLPPAVDFSELHFELLHQRVAAAVEVSDGHELSGGRFRVRTHVHLDLVQLEFGFLQTGARRRDGLPKIVRVVERASVHSGHIHLEHRIRAEESGQFARAGDFEERVFFWFYRGGFGSLAEQLANPLFIVGK